MQLLPSGLQYINLIASEVIHTFSEDSRGIEISSSSRVRGAIIGESVIEQAPLQWLQCGIFSVNATVFAKTDYSAKYNFTVRSIAL